MQTITLMALMAGCNEPKETGEPAEPDTSVDTDTDTDTDEEPNYCAPGESTGAGPRVDGTIEFADGTAVGGNVRVQMCAYSCFIAAWGENGDFCFREGVLETGTTYAFDAVPTTGDNTYATPLTFITLDETGLVLTDPVQIPTFAYSATVSNGSMEAGDGLTVTIDSTNFEAETVYAVPVDHTSAGLPLPSELDNKTILGMWYFGPFDESTGGTCSIAIHTNEDDCLADDGAGNTEPTWTQNHWPISLESTGLSEGTQVNIYNTIYHDKTWEVTGTATVNSDGLLVSDTDSGIANLSVLLLAY